MIKLFTGKAEQPEGDGYYLALEEEMNEWERDNLQWKVITREVRMGNPGKFYGWITYV